MKFIEYLDKNQWIPLFVLSFALTACGNPNQAHSPNEPPPSPQKKKADPHSTPSGGVDDAGGGGGSGSSGSTSGGGGGSGSGTSPKKPSHLFELGLADLKDIQGTWYFKKITCMLNGTEIIYKPLAGCSSRLVFSSTAHEGEIIIDRLQIGHDYFGPGFVTVRNTPVTEKWPFQVDSDDGLKFAGDPTFVSGAKVGTWAATTSFSSRLHSGHGSFDKKKSTINFISYEMLYAFAGGLKKVWDVPLWGILYRSNYDEVTAVNAIARHDKFVSDCSALSPHNATYLFDLELTRTP